MSFGPIMQLKVPQKNSEPLMIELAPLEKEVMGMFIANGAMQSLEVNRYLLRTFSPVLEDEIEWYEKVRTARDSMIWGIWVRNGQERAVIGTTGLNSIEYGPTGFKQAVSGVLIFDRTYWGRSIASHIHRARTWYAFTELGLTRIKSAVMQPNVASRKALEKCGYAAGGTERNISFTNGQLVHKDNLECLNPNEPFWGNWWGEDTPPKKSERARKLTQSALIWAKANVTLP